MSDPRQVRTMFARIARRYDLLNRVLSLGIDQRWRRRMLAQAGEVRGVRVVDLCCGTGDVSLCFARAGARVVGVDFTPQMLERAERKRVRAAAAGVFATGDALALPIGDARAEVCTVAFGIRNVADRRACLREMRRVLVPGGRGLVLEFSLPPGRCSGWLYRAYFTRVLPAIGRLVSRHEDAYSYLPRTVLAWPEPPALQREMEEEGFVECGFRRLTFGIACLHWGSGRGPVKRRAEPDPRERSQSRAPSLALGYLALLPLIAAHECGSALDPAGLVNLGAALLLLPLAPFGARALEVSWVVYGLLGALSLVLLFRAEYALLPRLLRVLGEGALAALALGPLLLGLCWLLGVAGEGSALRASPPEHTPALARVGVLCGGAAFEEIVFRLGCLSIVFVLARRGLCALGASAGAAAHAAEALALLLSALVFALAHLALVVEPLLGAGGEPFEAAVFTWRVLAGILLGILFRWRGMGVAGWAHALFNLALTIGAGPEILL